MKRFLLLLLLLPALAHAQVFSQNQVIVQPYVGVIYSTSTSFGAKLSATTSPTVGYITATSTTGTSTFPLLHATTAVNLLGEYFTNFTTYVRSLFTGGDGITYTAGDFDCDTANGSTFGCLSAADWTTFNNKESALTFGDGLTRTANAIDFTCTEVEGTGINCSTNDITLDATGDWTGTLDGQEGSYYLARANHTGTQAASTISDFDEAAQDAVGTILVDGSSIDLTYTDASPLISAEVKNNAISDLLLRDSTALSVIGRAANSTGDPNDIAAVAASGAVLRESGSTLGFGTIVAAGIASDAVTEPKLKAVDSPADEECLEYESTTGDFEWEACGTTQWTTNGADIHYPSTLGAGNVGIGTTTPSAKLSIHASNGETNQDLFVIASSTASATTTVIKVNPNNSPVVLINRNAVIPPAPAGGDTMLQFANADGVGTRMVLDVFGAGNPNYVLRRSGGTAASSTAMVSGDNLGQLSWFAYGASGYSSAARAFIRGTAAENWSDSAQGMHLGLYTNATGAATTPTERLHVDAGGNIGIASTTPWRRLSVVGTMAINGLTSSTAGNAVCILANFDVVNAGGTTCIASSGKTKKNVNTLSGVEATRIVMGLRPKVYENREGGDIRFGFIAEDAEKIDPRLVEYAIDDITLPNGITIKKGDPHGFDYLRYTAVLTATVQAQQMQIEDLTKRIEALEKVKLPVAQAGFSTPTAIAGGGIFAAIGLALAYLAKK